MRKGLLVNPSYHEYRFWFQRVKGHDRIQREVFAMSKTQSGRQANEGTAVAKASALR
jgi:hypothetical protein